MELQALHNLDQFLADVGRIEAVVANTMAELQAKTSELHAVRSILEDAEADVVDAAALMRLQEAVEDVMEERWRVTLVAGMLLFVRAVAVAASSCIRLLPVMGLAIIAAAMSTAMAENPLAALVLGLFDHLIDNPGAVKTVLDAARSDF
ncbi:hypothetical protein E2562_021474 [Oryza meyeriana var. granulata]|uniref:Uncharacterized protein n=1 Tax=Oryza meyeriana var. granulata TaxID=110450 RepID=A0A6G1DZZ2_9ORYZ|nr:hypothetical protein E2562_021474 [Oryza meyeriana var. granulata]